MSGARILANSVPCLLNAFAGWKQPVHVRAVATISGGVITMSTVDPTTPGVAITTAGSGVHALTFPACRRIGSAVGNVAPNTPGTIANARFIMFAPQNPTAAEAGSLTLRTVKADGVEAIADPENGSTMEVSVWLDLG